jgi:hypothetical protein
MSFFIRVWVQGTDIPFINSKDDVVTSDMVDISPATVIDAEVDGDYMDAGQVRDAMTLTGDVVSISGRDIISQSVSQRPVAPS